MKIQDIDAWEPAPGDLFVIRAHGSSPRRIRLIIAISETSTLVAAWANGNFCTSEAYSRYWLDDYREYVVEVYRP